MAIRQQLFGLLGCLAIILGLVVAPPQALAQERQTIIVALGFPATGDGPVARSDRNRAVAAQVADLLDVSPEDIEALPELPYLFVDAPIDTDLETLRSIEGVRGVYPDQRNVAFLDQSLIVIGQPDAIRSGATGRGRTVAILDTGADYHVADLGTCVAPGPDCRIVETFEAAPDDGTLDGQSRHGTNVASIAARVAPAASVVSIDVFDGQFAPDTAVLRGLDWVYRNRQRLGIVAINLSLGSSSNHAERCSDIAYDSAFQLLNRSGIAIVAAAGNDGVTTGTSRPSCHPLAYSVGATTDASLTYSACNDGNLPVDAVPCFSNSANSLAIRAPGTQITAGGETQSGTSQAAPHVTGAIAALMSTDSAMTSDTAMRRLIATGVPVRDSRMGLVRPRLSLGSAANRAPVAARDTGRIVDGAGGLFDVLSNDTDEDSSSLRLISVWAPDGCWARTAGRRVYAGCRTAGPGQRLFRYSVEDRYGLTSAAELAITVVRSSGIPERIVASGRVSAATSTPSDQGPMLAWIARGTTSRVMTEWLRPDGASTNNLYEANRGRPGAVTDRLVLTSRGPQTALAWVEVASDGTNIIATHFDGPLLGRPYDATFQFAKVADRPSATILDGLTVIGWQEEWNPTRLHAATFDSNTMPGPVSPVQNLTPYLGPADVQTHTVTASEYLAFRMGDQGLGIYAYRFNRTGADMWSGPRDIRRADGGMTERISDFDVAPLSNGTFAVVWSETERLSASGIWYLVVNADARVIHSATRITDRVLNRASVSVSALDAGAFRVAWTASEPGFDAILSTRVMPGTPAGPIEVDFYSEDAARKPRDIDVLSLGNGQYHLMWPDLGERLNAVVRSPLPN